MPKIIEDETIYRAAIQVVLERGYAGATTVQIAEAADISEVTLFRRYGSKAQLVKKAITAVAQATDFASAAQYTGDVEADLLRVVRTYQEAAEEQGPFFYTVLMEIPRQPELAAIIETPLMMVNDIGHLMARYQAEGVLKQEHPLQAVAGLLGPLMVTNMIRATHTAVPLPPPDLPQTVAGFLDGRCLAPGQENW